jgi:hypothetical protein
MLRDLDVIDLAPGLWIWRIEHPSWKPNADWQPVVTCVCVEASSERWLLDPLLPPDDATKVWDRLAEKPPTAVAVLSPDHMRRTWDDPHIMEPGCCGPPLWMPRIRSRNRRSRPRPP